MILERDAPERRVTALPLPSRRRVLALVGLAGPSLAGLAGCAAPLSSPGGLHMGPRPTQAFEPIPYATWGEDEPGYRLYPGDVLDIAVPSAPELARTVTVQPDGRITLPLIPQPMVADRSVPELQAILSQAYASQLRYPQVEVTVKQSTPLKVFVGGEVDKPGVYDMPGDIDAVQAVTMAGGFKISAKTTQVVIIRRGSGGRPMMRVANLKEAIFNPGRGDAVPLRRFDIVFVPRSTIAEVGVFVQQYLRDTIPIQFTYAVNGNYISTVAQP
jgi:protein involved in polysaccharide export with SLBB domain